jgi:hypothetical protein
MKPLYRGIAVALLQCLIVLTVAGKYALDRQRLPRVWVKAAPVDPSLPVRGRYVSLRLEVAAPPETGVQWMSAQLSVQDGRLVATPGSYADSLTISRFAGGPWSILDPVAFFSPEHVPDPSRPALGEELWVEVSVPRQGSPRPLRLALKKDGVLTPLDLR